MEKSSAMSPASVVIPTWNAAGFVDRVLAELVRQEGVSYEILVVDNGVVNRETEIVCERWQSGFPRLRYLAYPRQLGYAGAVNAGTREASHDLIAVLNNDNLPEARWLCELVRAYESAKREGREAVVSSLVPRADLADPLGARLNLWGRIVRVPRPTEAGKLTEYVPFHPDGSAFLFSRTALGEPYDEDYFIYHEDVALGWRARLQGGDVIMAAASRAETFDGGSTRRIAFRTAFYTERNRWLNYFLFLSLGSLLRIAPALFFDTLAKGLAGSQRRAKLKAWSWLLLHPGVVLAKRREMQARRRRPDHEILPHLSRTYANPGERGAALLAPLMEVSACLSRLPFGK